MPNSNLNILQIVDKLKIDLNELSINSWAFEEAKKIIIRVKNIIPKKGYILFETGYGPSGLPHIGTFGEVVRVAFVRYALSLLAPHLPTKLYCVSDDIDGLRKIPENIPNKELIASCIGKPLTSIPDPFGTHESYGHHMNSRLRGFLDGFGFEYHFVSATEKYRSGAFNSTMIAVMHNYEKLMKLMLPTLGEERRLTYSPFMPIDKKTGIVIDKGMKSVNKENLTVSYLDPSGEMQEISILDGNCKLQWKIDFGARWFGLGVDYEIYGKDHQPNEKIYRSVCEILGGEPPVNFTYEMFLSDTGEKISKSKGNGISVEEWLKYAPWQSMSLFMYQKPKTAKRLYFDVIPKATDDYLAFLNSFSLNLDIIKQSTDRDLILTKVKENLENPVFFINFGDVPAINFNINYSLLLNLASACNPENTEVLWGFISKYDKSINKENSPLLQQMVSSAVNYYNDFVRQSKVFRSPTDLELIALKLLISNISSLEKDDYLNNEVLQNVVFRTGRESGYENNMKDWFSSLYQILLGQNQGPRMGSFIALFGVDNFIGLVRDKIDNISTK